MAAANYIVTVQRPTAVTAVTIGHFTSSTDLNLLVAKNTHFEIYLMSSEGLKLVKDVCIYGRIAIMKCFRPPQSNKDVVFIYTEKHHGMILDCKKSANDQYDIITKCHGILKDFIKLPIRAILCAIDAKHGIIVLRIVEGLLKLIYLKDSTKELSKTMESYNVKVDEQNIIDLQFLPGYQKPTFALIHSCHPDSEYQQNNKFFFKTYQIEMKDKDISKTSWKQEIDISEPAIIIPGEDSCIVIGRNAVALYKENDRPLELELPLLDNKVTGIIGHCSIDPNGGRYLLSDWCGKLYLLVLECEKKNGSLIVTDMKLNLLGETSVSENIIYLDNGVAFIGSRSGDSQLIRLLPEPRNGSHLEILESYTNLGPILDMCIVDIERQGRQLVTCSGFSKDSSLRIVRTGIGIQEHASIDLRNIKGIWSLKISSKWDNYLVISFFEQTRMFYLQNDEVEEVELTGFDFQHQTLLCSNIIADQILQITTHSIRLIGNNGKDLIVEWKNSNQNNEITVSTCNATQCLCAIGNELHYFEIGQSTFTEISKCTLPYNIACMDVTPVNYNEERSNLCVIGLWTHISVWTLRLPTLEVQHKEPLTNGRDTDRYTLPRTVIMVSFDSQPYVVVSLADGPIIYFLLDVEQGLLYERKKVSLGTKPTTLTLCRNETATNDSTHHQQQRTVLFACSDRPSVIYSSNQKLMFSCVNLHEVICMCSFNSELYGSSLTLVTENGVVIGKIDDMQKLHIGTINLGEPVRRIAYHEEEKSYVILTQSTELFHSDRVIPISQHAHQTIDCPTKIKTIKEKTQHPIDQQDNIVILDQHTLEARVSIKLLSHEEGMSVCILNFTDEINMSYIIVGTAIVYEDELEQKMGRLLVFHYNDGKINFVTEKDINAPPHTMAKFNGKLIVGIGNSIHLYNFSPNNQELVLITQYTGYFETLQLKIKDDFVLFCDMMKSLTVLRYNLVENKFEEIAHDGHPLWTMACEVIDDDTFICSEDASNLISCHKDSGSTKESERKQLKELGFYHLGETINVFCPGSLITQQSAQSSIPLQSCILMAAISGYIGLLIQLTPHLYQILMALQLQLAKLPSVGKIDHATWRAFESEMHTDVSCGFIDGDLIELYLDLSKDMKQDVIRNLRGENNVELHTTVDELVKAIEELSRIH
ncbi:unnamed protein product [Didymodactylos carnosus]|uniref:DNA damage-binding protein 1 n=1 Tax=Didymodactylos carnosus TaxID=1234261 RepID=A0A814G4Z9_9BILA|nr:unnamed protein product [Didymodactylos carnosus]CAF0991836.1 unnamed protein product [Didymodactylos carnosus]CAF3580333.1 unnamed protein product [Didymodactylos carnosus]CAF3763720.1 unnamed protein product [Didymodactylos carnosus]